MTKTPFKTKRIYESASQADGARILVDRLWPRGISKEDAKLDQWLSEIAPSDALRERFHDGSLSWEEFREAYARELESAPGADAVKALRDLAGNGPVTLLYASRDEARNNAQALKRYLNGG